MVLAGAKMPPRDRTKPLFGVVRGMGSGKTRCLEEIRRELLKRPRVLAIGITFDTIKGIKGEELIWGENYQTAFALMVIARIASTLYGKDLADVRQSITRALSKLDSFESVDLGREEFLRYAVTTLRSQGKCVDDLVVIVDEIAKTEDRLKNIYDKVEDPCAVLREALLNNKTEPFSFNATLHPIVQ